MQTQKIHQFLKTLLALALLFSMALGWQGVGARAAPAPNSAHSPSAPGATQSDILGPPGSGAFGSKVYVLPNGNFVVTDPYYDDGAIADVGAVYLYNGYSLALISSLTGSQASDRVGSDGVTVLTNGNYLVRSSDWDAPGPVTDVGAVTWCDGGSGCNGMVSAANSLVGGTSNDGVGFKNPSYDTVVLLSNGNYVIPSPFWDAPGPVANAGAVTWCNGASGCTGAVSATNSLVGSQAGDQVGYGDTNIDGVVLLSNDNYVVRSVYWDAPGPVTDVGAATWCDGTSGCTGVVSAVNSLVGRHAYDEVSGGGVTALSNGNYVVGSPGWNAPGSLSDVGAVTWCDGSNGCIGEISATNSLVGSQFSDRVGSDGISLLTNGNYVVHSQSWSAPGSAENVGAVTWCDESSGCTGAVSAANSLVGSTASDYVGSDIVTALSNGNYVVPSPYWDAPGPVSNVGAATWCDGTSGCTGAISSANCLVGITANDRFGYGDINIDVVTALSNGNYVVGSPGWDAPGPLTNAGAATWCDGSTGCTGVISTTNSLVGSTADDGVGYATALSNGNYVVGSPDWDAPGPVENAGAATWCDGSSGCTGTVSAANSLVGSTAGDQVGYYATSYKRLIFALGNGNYVVSSPRWGHNPGWPEFFGAVTWCDGSSGCTGTVSVANSLVGSRGTDQVGESVTALSNGNYVVISPRWESPSAWRAGAVTWCDGSSGCIGEVSAANSLVGSSENDMLGYLDVGNYEITELNNGNYLVYSPYWDAPGPVTNAGALTLGAGYAAFPVGALSSSNSVTGAVSKGMYPDDFSFDFDYLNDQLVVGLKDENKVSVFKQPHTSIQSGAWGAPDTWDYGAPVERSDIDLDGGYTVSLGADAAAENLVLTSGRVALGAYNLTVDQSLTVDGTPGVERMVVADGVGALRKRFTGTGSFTFPVGDQSGTAEYSPFTIDFSAGSFAADAYVAVGVTNAKHPSNPATSYIQRYWTATQNGISDYIYDAVMGYVPADVVGTEASTHALKYNAGNWMSGGAADTLDHTYSFKKQKSLSDFTGGDSPTSEYTLTVNIAGNGVVGCDPEQTTYHYGDVITLTATSDPGWSFYGWSGDLISTDITDSITIYGNTAVTASFLGAVYLPLVVK